MPMAMAKRMYFSQMWFWAWMFRHTYCRMYSGPGISLRFCRI